MPESSPLRELELDLKRLIVQALELEGIDPEEIESEEPLFVEGLGLDSIDALELGVAIRKRYGVKIEAVDDQVKAHFASVRALARFIDAQRRGSA